MSLKSQSCIHRCAPTDEVEIDEVEMRDQARHQRRGVLVQGYRQEPFGYYWVADELQHRPSPVVELSIRSRLFTSEMLMEWRSQTSGREAVEVGETVGQ